MLNMSQKNKDTKDKSKIFMVLYAIGFIGATVIGLFGSSFFAYEIFDSLWAAILSVLFISMLFITAYIQEVLSSRKIENFVLNSLVFIGGLLFFLLFLFFDGIFSLSALIFSAVMLCVIGIRYAVSVRNDPTRARNPDVKGAICLGAMLIFIMVRQMDIEYVSEVLWAWALIPAAVVFFIGAVIVFAILKKVWSNIFLTKLKSIFGAIALGFIVFVGAWAYSATAIGVINCTFDGEPIRSEYTVIDKNVRSGARSVTKFEIKVIIDEREKWISLPATDYYEISKGDTVIIDYYGGALNFAYYTYSKRK